MIGCLYAPEPKSDCGAHATQHENSNTYFRTWYWLGVTFQVDGTKISAPSENRIWIDQPIANHFTDRAIAVPAQDVTILSLHSFLSLASSYRHTKREHETIVTLKCRADIQVNGAMIFLPADVRIVPGYYTCLSWTFSVSQVRKLSQ